MVGGGTEKILKDRDHDHDEDLDHYDGDDHRDQQYDGDTTFYELHDYNLTMVAMIILPPIYYNYPSAMYYDNDAYYNDEHADDDDSDD